MIRVDNVLVNYPLRWSSWKKCTRISVARKQSERDWLYAIITAVVLAVIISNSLEGTVSI